MKTEKQVDHFVKARFHYERGKKHFLFVLLIFFALASILTARFNRRSIKERKNALFHARSGNGPLVKQMAVRGKFIRKDSSIRPALAYKFDTPVLRSARCFLKVNCK